jgi:putative copper resistance protein D
MSALFSIFGFLSVILHGLDLIAQTVLLGSVFFLLLLALPLAPRLARDGDLVLAGARRVIQIAALAGMAAVMAGTALNAAVLQSSLDIPWPAVASASFVVVGLTKALATLAILLIATWRPLPAVATRVALAILAAIVLAAALADSHATARLDGRSAMYLVSGLHQIGAAIWLGGLPCFALALRRVVPPDSLALIGRRYSLLAMAGVGLIVIGAIFLSVGYIGSLDGFWGTAYGAMAATKGVLLCVLLLLGLGNFLSIRHFAGDGVVFGRVRRFVVVEIGIAIAVLLAAASITSLPPAVDLTNDRVSLAEIGERMMPELPRLTSPDRTTLGIPVSQAQIDAAGQLSAQASVPGAVAIPPRSAAHVAWSEYNHHWAGVIVLLMGIFALAERSGYAPWAKHWPLLFLLLAIFLFLRNDPDVWPLGPIGLLESLQDPEVVQHRFYVLLTAGFAFFEWGVRTGRLTKPALAFVFPLLTVVGGTALLAHSHIISNVKDQLLIELTHLPMAVVGILAGWTRWLQIKAPEGEGRWAGWVWPACFVLIGLLLLDYREA